MNYVANIRLIEDQIEVEVSNIKLIPNVEYAYSVYYYPDQRTSKTLLIETEYMAKNNKYQFTVEKPGYYFVKCFIRIMGKKTSRDTDTVLYIDKSIREEFNSLMSQDLTTKNTINEPIDYFKVASPQNDFCIISEKKNSKDKSKLNEWCKNNSYTLEKLKKKFAWNTENTIIYDNSKKQVGKKNNYIFSGYMWDNDKFYFGQEDIPHGYKIENAYENMGMFSLLNIESNEIKLTTDYFSYCKIYYYIEDEIFIASNSYHLLVLTMANIGLECNLDEDMIYSIFSSNVTLFRQPVSTRMMVKNTYSMNLCDEIIINRSGWKINKRPSHDLLSGSDKYDEKTYRDLIEAGKNEIISNVKAVLNNDKFNEFVLELSGGKDSRTTFAALTNIEGAKDKVKIKSTNHEPNDLDIAVGLTNIFGYKHVSNGDTWYVDDVLNYIKRKRSYFCGIRYLYYVESKHSGNQHKMTFNGECFESLAVRYYSNTIRNMNLDKASKEKLVDSYSTLLSKQAIIDYSTVSDVVKKELLNGINDIPSSTSTEAFDNMYLFYRAGITAGNMDRMYYTNSTCMPLQSKALLEAKKIWINNFEKEKIIFDITYALNPLLASLPYNNKRYNETRKEMHNKLLFEDVRFKECNVNLDFDKTEYNEAEKENNKNNHIVKTENYIERDVIPKIVWENCLLSLQKLGKLYNGKYRETLSLPLYYYINAEKNDDTEVRLIYNKVIAVLDILDSFNTL